MIGVFDSGVGGLSSLIPLKKLLPAADILYLADTAALPLGEKSDEEIRARIALALAFFDGEGADAVLLACGTASSLVTDECKAEFAFPIYDIIAPTASAARCLSKDARILLLSTPAAARAGRFAAAFARGSHPVYTLACPAFVHMAEGRIPKAPHRIERVLAPLFPLSPDVLVLGCTHFSLLKEEIALCYPEARIFDPAYCGAAAVAAHRKHADKEAGQVHFFTTGDPRPFAASASRILGHSITATKIHYPH